MPGEDELERTEHHQQPSTRAAYEKIPYDKIAQRRSSP